ncbi:MAG: hypothetical protein H7138_17970, partial [Myxococcales bacterium]|nr:hypothetical protein [Myxococcales bacterium]
MSGQPDETIAMTNVTDAASETSKFAELRFEAMTVRRGELAKRYQDELHAIDRLKNQRVSWRRDRELRDRLSSSLETANQLSTATRELERAKQRLARARRSHLLAIEAELAKAVTPARELQLRRTRSALALLLKDAPRHIVIPDLEVDLLADPEELDQRAAELRESEEELHRQLAALREQIAELDRRVALRKQHERAGNLVNRDDDQPHRNAPTRSPELPSDGDGDGDGGGGQRPDPGPPPMVPPDSYVPIVLAEVIDATPSGSPLPSPHSGDPA